MTSDLLDRGLAMAQAGSPWIGPALGGAAFAEAVVVVGLFVPVTPFLILAGAAMGAGALDHGTAAWVSAGAFLGNALSYQLGRGLRARGAPPVRLPARARVAAERLFARHGAAAIVIARFLGPPATVAPFLAGWSGLPRGRFMIASLLASLAWPPLMIGAGALVAQALSFGLASR
ncbi:DedA family protein [Caulobacter sp. UC70_42]|uniref:DedA family protein n=1 Tax=Caulobacter sp. UC70_42 TaxID=3374551 RepID=UPI003757500E